MKLKLDLHPIFNDAERIETALAEIIEKALTMRADEVEVIPGKGSGALKKGVLRYLDKPQVRQKYHRIEKDSDNWGRLFIHFKHDRSQNSKADQRQVIARGTATCMCCSANFSCELPDIPEPFRRDLLCPACDTPIQIRGTCDRAGKWHLDVYLNY